ncbi:MAG: endonuclease III [Chloroflexi bacterium]|nr:endonuclease III [Chloroflexota bacterium]
MKDPDIHRVITILRQVTRAWAQPYVTALAQESRDPFRVLISTMLSLRTKDAVTAESSRRLFTLASTPQTMLKLAAREIEKAIYPVGFYRTKARNILLVCRELVERHKSQVPSDLNALIALPGVGRKTANLVITQGFGELGICVDTHVHRIMNRWGYVKTGLPDQTEMALREKLPREYWIEINDHLVALGQNICHPTSPKCSLCPINGHCARVGVTRSR